ncbi:hypothetical protein Tco_0918183 [Tanacetum coccineum]
MGLGYRAARRRALELAEGPMPSTFEVGQSTRSVPDQQVADETPRLPTRPIWVDPEDGTIYLDIEFDPSSRAPVQTPASPEWSSGSLPVTPASLSVPSPVASPVTTPAATIAIDEDEFLEVEAQLELHGSILHDHTQHLDALPLPFSKARYEDQREMHALRMQHVVDQREMQGLRERVDTLERRMNRLEM